MLNCNSSDLECDSKLVRKRIGTKQQAIQQLNKVRFIRASGEGIVGKSAKQPTRSKAEIQTLTDTDVTVAELADGYLAHIQDENNPDRPQDQENPPQRLNVIKEAFGDRPAAVIKPFEVTDWLKRLQLVTSDAQSLQIDVLGARYAKERGQLTVNPVRDVPQFGVILPPPRFLTVEQEQQLRAVLKKWIDDCPGHHELTKLYLRCHPLELTIAMKTGMRKGNQYRLRWSWCDFASHLIHLPRTKNGEAHTIPMIDDVYKALIELRQIQKEILSLKAEGPGKQVRMVANGRVFNISENRSWWERALKEAEIENFRWHDLRHTFCSRLAQAGKGLKVIQEGAGHKTIAMSARYAHLDQTTLRNAMSVLNDSP